MWLRIGGVVVCGLALCALPARAQEQDGAIGYGGGVMHFGDFGAGAGGSALGLGTGWIATGEVEQWLGSKRVGVRGTASFTQRPLDLSEGNPRDINAWLFDGELLLRLLPAAPGHAVAPYIAAGAGAVSYGLGHGSPVVLTSERLRYPGDTSRQFAAVFGGGIDIYPRMRWFGTPIGIRLEAADHMVLHSPFETTEGRSLGPLHNVRVDLMFLGLVDLLH